MAEPAYRSILVLGGASSGKSALAQRLAASLGERVLFVATAWPSDQEMARRIARHQAERPLSWRLIERPSSLKKVISALGDAEVLLFDCLSLWLAGLLPEEEAPTSDQGQRLEQGIRLQVHQLFAECARRCHLIAVSDEVGMGLVPPYPLGRRYRELLGRLNQMAAEDATTVYLLVAGVPLLLKGPDAGARSGSPL